MEHAINCLICNSNKYIPYKTFIDKKVNIDQKFTLVQCDCNFIYLNPRPNELEISKYYNDDYLPHSNRRSFLYDFFQKSSFYLKYRLIFKLKRNCKNLLDIGGGKGEFVDYINNKDINAINYDLYTNENVTELPALCNSNQKFDIITMWHSLEHIHNVNDLMICLYELLADNGYLIIALPNQNACERTEYFPDTWIAYDVPRHLYHFSYNSFNGFIKKYKFKILNFIPLYQDLFFNIFMSNKKKYSYLKLFLILIKCLYSIFLDKKKSSSFIFICKK